MKSISLSFMCFIVSMLCHGIIEAQTTKEKKTTVKEKQVYVKDLTVSALRQPEKNLEVPLAVTVLGLRDIQLKRGYGIDDILQSVPGVLVQNRVGNQDLRITIRGFGARGAGERSNAGTTRGIRVLVDGIPETEPDGRTALDFIQPLSIQSAEILRSNSSALFGNASGGVISFSTIPKDPSTKIQLNSQIGSFGLIQNTVHAQGMTDLGLIYATIGRSSFEGWREHSNSSALQVSAGLVHQPSTRTKVGMHVLAGNVTFQIPGPLNFQQYLADPKQSADTSVFKPTFVERNERRNNTSGRLGLTIDHELSSTLSISGMTYLQSKFLQRSERNTFRDFTRYHTGGSLMLKSANELSSSIQSMFLIGIDYQYQDGAILFYNLINGNRGNSLRTNKREGAQNMGFFLQEELMIDDEWSVILGGRYDNISYFNAIYIDGGLPVFSEQDMSFERFTPKAGITWRMNEDMSLYANVGGGVEVPAGNETDPPASLSSFVINPLLEPIISTSYELGYKFQTLTDDWLGLGEAEVKSDIALYHINTVNDIVPYSGGRFYFSAGQTSRLGIELSHAVQWANGFSINASLTASDNSYDSYVIDSLFAGNATGVSFLDYSGNAMAGIPTVFGSLQCRYSPKWMNGLGLGLDYRQTGSYHADDANTLNVDPFDVVDFSVSYEFNLMDDLSAKVFGRMQNVFDAKYVSGVWINPDKPRFADPAYIEPGLPRNIVVGTSLTWK
ncbi:MAG: TonB-dependent receptor [Candidatus Kapaibacteriota bacterium]